MYSVRAALRPQRIETAGTFGQRVAAQGGYYPFDRERRRTYPVGGESPESKGRKPAGRAADALCMGQGSRDARVQGRETT